MWKKISTFDYEVSSTGEVRRIKTNKLLTPHLSINGYLRVTLYDNGKTKIMRVHQLVAQAFIPNPNDLVEVNHKDGNKLNNRVDNLEWCTHFDNAQHAIRNGLYQSIKIQRIDSKGVTCEYTSIREACRQNRMSPSTLCRHLNSIYRGNYWRVM